MKYVVLQLDRKKKEVVAEDEFNSSMDAIKHIEHAEKHSDTERYAFFQYKINGLALYR